MAPTTELVTSGPGRRGDESMRAFLDELRRERPLLFVERRLDEIVNEVEDYAARATKRDSYRLAVQAYLSDVAPQVRRPAVLRPRETPAERDARLTKDVARDLRRLLGSIGPTTIIGEKPLGDWKLGELRSLGGVFSTILEIAGPGNDERMVREVMKAGHWRRLRRLQTEPSAKKGE
jgi:hypothetical protein